MSKDVKKPVPAQPAPSPADIRRDTKEVVKEINEDAKKRHVDPDGEPGVG
jgi:hypothetical protein